MCYDLSVKKYNSVEEWASTHVVIYVQPLQRDFVQTGGV